MINWGIKFIFTPENGSKMRPNFGLVWPPHASRKKKEPVPHGNEAGRGVWIQATSLFHNQRISLADQFVFIHFS